MSSREKGSFDGDLSQPQTLQRVSQEAFIEGMHAYRNSSGSANALTFVCTIMDSRGCRFSALPY
jgi:hypothetical protein